MAVPVAHCHTFHVRHFQERNIRYHTYVLIKPLWSEVNSPAPGGVAQLGVFAMNISGSVQHWC